MLENIAKTLLSNNKIYIITHENPDGDALGSSFALKFALEKLGKSAEVVLSGDLPVSFNFTGWTPLVYSDNLNCECVVGLDFNNISRAGNAANLFENAKTKILLDHHLDCPYAGELIESCPDAAATGEIVYELIKILNSGITKEIAEGIYIAIMTDTGGCRYSNTSAQTHKILADIIDKIDHAYLARQVLEVVSKEKLEIQKFALNNFEFYENGKICVVSIKKSLIKNEDLLNGIVNMALNIEGVCVGVLFKEKDENITKISLRTVGSMDAREICSAFGGGGHKNAAGATIETSLEKAKEMLLKALSERI